MGEPVSDETNDEASETPDEHAGIDFSNLSISHLDLDGEFVQTVGVYNVETGEIEFLGWNESLAAALEEYNESQREALGATPLTQAEIDTLLAAQDDG
jgi:hypothetical protein